jgi:drug/metabolite transporter (DMT)-like permease
VRPTAKDWGLFFVCVSLWGSAYAMTRQALHHDAHPLIITAGRMWIATFLLHGVLSFARAKGKAPAATPNVQWKLALLGLFGGALPFAALSWSQTRIESGLVGILAALTPILVAATAWMVAPEDRLTPPKLIGVVIGFIGVVVLMGPTALSGLGSGDFLGQLAAASAAFAYAANTLLVRIGAPIPALEASAGWTLYGALFVTPFAIGLGGFATPPDAMGWAMIALLALGPTGIAAIAYFALIRSAGPSFATQTNYMLPLWAVALGAALFAERLGPNAYLALALIALGLFIAQDGVARTLRRLRSHAKTQSS